MNWRVVQRSEPLRRAVSAANQRHEQRRRIFVELNDSGFSGWGEVSPLAYNVAGDPGVDEVYEHLTNVAIARVSEIWQREHAAPRWSRVAALARNSAPSRWAHTAIEMALLDWELQQRHHTLASEWAVDDSAVETMGTVSLLDDERAWFVAPGTRRIRVKTTAGVNPEKFLDALEVLATPILLDFNTSAGSINEVQRQIEILGSRVKLEAVEQPFALGDFISHAELAREIDVPLSLDESVRSVLDVRQIARYRSAALVCIKPPRVGGIAVARSMLTTAHDAGLRTYIGGFFESPLARRAHRVLAAWSHSEPSDVGDVELEGDSRYGERASGIGVFPVLNELEIAGAFIVS
jgi:O-succinylbenzoate synthase